jgi:peptide-methionine (S)-S-oxide reductase
MINYDPTLITLDNILDIFWLIHNPTTLNKQGNDIGTQYRSCVFYQNEEQLNIIKKNLQNEQNNWKEKIVTEVEEAQKFYPAEKYHQNYYNQHQWQPYCQIVVKPKIDKILSLKK